MCVCVYESCAPVLQLLVLWYSGFSGSLFQLSPFVLCLPLIRAAMYTTSTKLAQPCQNASVAGAILMVECGYVEQIANYDSSGNLVQYCQLRTDVAHKQSRHLAREGATPARFKRKGNRAVSLPPPPSCSSAQPISLYFGGHLSPQSPAQKD